MPHLKQNPSKLPDVAKPLSEAFEYFALARLAGDDEEREELRASALEYLRRYEVTQKARIDARYQGEAWRTLPPDGARA